MTQISEDCNETPLESKREWALLHYEEAATAVRHWSSFVRDAIKFYDPKMQEELDRLRNELAAKTSIYQNPVAAYRAELKKKIEEMIVWHDDAVLVSKQLLFDLIDQTTEI